MSSKQINAIIISASSDIGAEMCKEWYEKGWKVCGTYRTKTHLLEDLEQRHAIDLVACDLSSKASLIDASSKLIEHCPSWDVLVFATGNLEPVGLFESLDFDEWEKGIQVNLLAQLHMLHRLLPYRNKNTELPQPSVLFFAGGGTNGAVLNYTSYTLSKIALIKMCELLDAEMPDTRFTIVGPGWVKTKIHEATLQAGMLAGKNQQQTKDKLNSKECTPMEDVIQCCNWLITTSSLGVCGRNFSVVYDLWGTRKLEESLELDPHLYKLRRCGNSLLQKDSL
ncbi:MAG: SDR family NAD(P)-dependent oxidoreductase [Chlamydiales bacterium]|nr:SDR family NAD(P)-dependent oxidoreductase [Chlamydiales bacterium]